MLPFVVRLEALRTWQGAAVMAAVAMALSASGNARAGDAEELSTPDHAELPAKPPIARRAFLQYGIAFTVEDVLFAGPICSDPNAPCILGSGGGILGRVGWRPTERLYIGGEYELSKQEPNKLYLLGILQQARANVRSYFPTGARTTPFVTAGCGVAGYGEQWAVDTWGPTAALGGGIEVQVSGGDVINLALLYRPIYLRSFVDSSTSTHNAGIAQFLGVELAVEAQDAL
jgi:opacity protein-like surface antigen